MWAFALAFGVAFGAGVGPALDLGAGDTAGALDVTLFAAPTAGLVDLEAEKHNVY